MLALERLIEAVEYADDENNLWWQQFGSASEAKRVLREASKYKPEEYEVSTLTEILQEDSPECFTDIPRVYEHCLSILRKQLR